MVEWVNMGKQIKSLILPIVGLIILPWLIISFTNTGAILVYNKSLQTILGILILLMGLQLTISSILLFIKVGKGTLAPWDPTQKLVVKGPYRYTRNPMIIGVLFIIFAEALLLGFSGLIIYAILFFLLNTIYFKFSEEPGLVKRFGNDYIEYRKNVPMWIPRLKPYDQSNIVS